MKARSIVFIMIKLWYFTDSFMSKVGRGGFYDQIQFKRSIASAKPNSPFDFTIPGSASFIWIPIKL